MRTASIFHLFILSCILFEVCLYILSVLLRPPRVFVLTPPRWEERLRFFLTARRERERERERVRERTSLPSCIFVVAVYRKSSTYVIIPLLGLSGKCFVVVCVCVCVCVCLCVFCVSVCVFSRFCSPACMYMCVLRGCGCGCGCGLTAAQVCASPPAEGPSLPFPTGPCPRTC